MLTIWKDYDKLYCNLFAIYYTNRRTTIAVSYKSFPILFIYSFLCAIREWTYRLSVIVGFLCPRISDNVLTSIPHSMALVANVCRNAWNPWCGMPHFFCSNSKLRWYDLTEIALSPLATTHLDSVRFLVSFSKGISCLGIGITRMEVCVLGVSVIRQIRPFVSLPS